MQSVPFTARALLPNPGHFPPMQTPPQPIRLQQQNRPVFIMQRPPPDQQMALQQGVINPYQQMFPYGPMPLYYPQQPPLRTAHPHTPTSLPHTVTPTQPTTPFPGQEASPEKQN